MQLSNLLGGLDRSTVIGDAAVEIRSVVHESAEVGAGALFCAVPGARYDGHDFAEEAARRGAAALLVERRVAASLPQVIVPSVRAAMGPVADLFYARPSRDVSVIGVTGTNGKGAVTFLTRAALESGGVRCGIVGTMGAVIGDQTRTVERTTPEAPEFQALLAEMRDAGVTVVAAEVASHALAMHRVDGTRFAAAAFTNLTQDHLDFHRTMDAYRETKALLFDRVDPDGVAVVNRDDPEGAFIAARSRAPVVTYGFGKTAEVRADYVDLQLKRCVFTAVTPRGRARIELPMAGRFNVANALCAIALAQHFGAPIDAIADGLRAFAGVPGRFELVDEGQPFAVVVDYAHSPDGLENVLHTAREVATGRVVVVFGCGGDRDRGKRPKMGAIAVALADHTIVTSDNPRSEEPTAIVAAIVAGAEKARRGGAPGAFEVEVDRRRAIEVAIRSAAPDDIVLICGKGHEPVQILKDRTIAFDDRAEARRVLRAIGRA
ncbi:MAG: UDP-N-acetylmuramoyl-L-alanyl-D-glutamate--2,6-diaminopimelate ligase [Armatimonadetes bacterium]|nr:UDP-N-acetylmuramoyl-L-alanyl-D-glutamate--2,6-diaminopimelate ligase [Armatimonadota bacterium]